VPLGSSVAALTGRGKVRSVLILSHSRLQAFRRCAVEERFHYILERESRAEKPDALSKGSIVDAAIAAHHMGQPVDLSEATPDVRALIRGYIAYYGPHSEDPVFACEATHVPWSLEFEGHTLVGEFDAIGTRKDSGARVILENKTCSEDIGIGSSYWQRVGLTDAQISTYLQTGAAEEVLYNVLRKPALRRLEANSKRKEPESDEDFEARCLADTAERPEYYFARARIVRLPHEAEAHMRDLRGTVHLMVAAHALGEDTPRSTGACFSFRRPCQFYSVCGLGADIHDDELFTFDTYWKKRAPAKPVEPCVVCGKPLSGSVVVTWLRPGKRGLRHEMCSPFGLKPSDVTESDLRDLEEALVSTLSIEIDGEGTAPWVATAAEVPVAKKFSF
jgi:hypothetical protein